MIAGFCTADQQLLLFKLLRTCESGKNFLRSTCASERQLHKRSRINARRKKGKKERKKERKILLKSGYKPRRLQLFIDRTRSTSLEQRFGAGRTRIGIFPLQGKHPVQKRQSISFLANLLFNDRKKGESHWMSNMNDWVNEFESVKNGRRWFVN